MLSKYRNLKTLPLFIVYNHFLTNQKGYLVLVRMSAVLLLLVISGCSAFESHVSQNTGASVAEPAVKDEDEAVIVAESKPQYQLEIAPNKRAGKSLIEAPESALLFEGKDAVYLLIYEPTEQRWILKGVTRSLEENFNYNNNNKANIYQSILDKYTLKQVKRFEYDQAIILEDNNTVLNYSVDNSAHKFAWTNYTADIAQLKNAIATQDIEKIKQLNIPTALIPSEVLKSLYESIQNSDNEEEIAVYEQIMGLVYSNDQ